MNISTIPVLEETKLVKTACTMLGEGVWTYGDNRCVESFESLAQTLHVDPHKMVRVNQKHTALVFAATKKDGGRGIYRPHLEKSAASYSTFGVPCQTEDAQFDYSLDNGIDGLITNEIGVTLCTTEADCVPVFLLDPTNKAIGMIHSGWRGTAARISARAIAQMHEMYGTKAHEVIAALGPCICKSCYEVGPELKDYFAAYFPPEDISKFFTPLNSEKFLLDVPSAVQKTLIDAGVAQCNISMPCECTCHSNTFASYRRDHNPHDRMLTALVLV